jgi:hypothetical protein
MDDLDKTLQTVYGWGNARKNEFELADGSTLILAPDGYMPHKYPPLEPKLSRISEIVTFYDLDSFQEYVQTYKSDATRIFSMPGHINSGIAWVEAVFDYHSPPAAADYAVHRARYMPPYSVEWTRWTKAPVMEQVAFAEFIEENRRDIQSPDAANLLDIINKFKATSKQSYDSLVNQADGSILVHYSDKVEAREGGVVVPAMLELGIPVFFRETRARVPVFMRYKLNNGKVMFTIKVDRADYIEQASFDDIIKTVKEATQLPVHFGRMVK